MKSFTRFASLTTLFATLLSPSAAVLAQVAEPPPAPRQISVSGESSVYVTPDEVVIGVGVETFDKALDATKKRNDEQSRALLAAIKDAGVEQRHIQTDELRVSVDYNDSGRSRGVEGYTARREYRVTLKDPKKTEAVVDACLKSGANLLLGIDYRSTELRKHRDEARKMAIKAAREKATLLAGELGEQIGRPRTISEGSFGLYGWGGGGWDRGRGMMQNSMQVRDGGAGVEGETIPIGQIAITAQVSVTFDLNG